jgi:AraC-like DNA-binding protein
MARSFIDRLVPARTPLERLVERGLLLEVAVQFGHAAHTTFHRQYADERLSASSCRFLSSAAIEEWPRDLATSPAEAFRRWATRYASAFREAHPLSCAREAEAYIQQHFREAIAATELAARLQCPIVFLRRTFRQLTGQTILEYQSALRLREALRLLAQSDLKMEAIAQEVGYRSKKDLYRVVHASLQCTPLEFRQAAGRGKTPPASSSRNAAATGRGTRP